KQKAVLYVNSDTNHRGTLSVEGSQDFEGLADAVSRSVIDPEKNVSVGERMRAHLRLASFDSHGEDKDHVKAVAAFAADPARDLPIDAIGSGSDYGSFVNHLGIPVLNLGYSDEGKSSGVYHSRYDTFEHHSRFVDPGFVYDSLLAKTIGRAVLMAADSDLPLQRPSDFAAEIAHDLKEVKKLAEDGRDKARKQAAMLRDNAFTLDADPTKPFGAPTTLKPVPVFDFSPLDLAVARLTKSAKTYDDALAQHGAALSASGLAQLQSLMQNIDQTLTADVGLPGRPWFRNLIYAPGTLTGYGVKTLPGVREGIEQERFDDAVRYTTLTAGVLNAYCDRLDQASALLRETQQAAR
ncbi:MAG TPA: transferrin receptor-like dimerization domain-containing protein, partial [Rhizomicrobium sp.]|nr:transferrin receptor-like dimerization domain-containing protein [Rhizomicrobium sp.]